MVVQSGARKVAQIASMNISYTITERVKQDKKTYQMKLLVLRVKD